MFMSGKSKLEHTSVNPLEGYEDWIGDGKVITITTIKEELYEKWGFNAVDYENEETTISHEDFDVEKVREPGVYNDPGDGCYTIILPYDFMIFSICEEYVEKLNEKFDENIELIEPEEDDEEAEKDE